MKKHSKLGFSLIELSIVILVIGILLIGITQGSRIIKESKIKSARALTSSSPINSTTDLAIWLDSTSEKSFDKEVANGSAVQNWYDINPIDTSGKKATQATLANRPIYVDPAINGLPAVRFNRSNSQSMSISDGFDGDSENVTLFLVWSPLTADGNENDLLEKWNGSGGYPYSLRSYTNYTFGAYDATNNPVVTSTTARKIGSTYLLSARRSAKSTMQLWVNGVQEGGNVIDNTATATHNNRNLFIGCSESSSQCADGHIAEIAIFRRVLKDAERQAIEQYLIQKWGIR